MNNFERGVDSPRGSGPARERTPGTERLSDYCPHGDRGMQNAPEEAPQPRYRRAAPPRVKGEGVAAGRDRRSFEMTTERKGRRAT